MTSTGSCASGWEYRRGMRIAKQRTDLKASTATIPIALNCVLKTSGRSDYEI